MVNKNNVIGKQNYYIFNDDELCDFDISYTIIVLYAIIVEIFI